MDTVDPARFVMAFAVVLGLIGLLALVLKRYAGIKNVSAPWLARNGNNGRIKLVETLYLDTRRKVVLLKRDDTAHLVLMADGRETLLETFTDTHDETPAA